VLRALAQLDLPVPVPVHLEPNTTDLGPPFMLTTRLVGSPAGTFDRWNNPLQARAIAEDMAHLLARLHTIDLATLDIPDAARGCTPEQRLMRKIYRYWEKWRRTRVEYSPLVECAFAWIKEECRRGGIGGPSILHGDFGPHNTLTQDGRVTGMVDWELLDIGDPAEDLTYFKASIVQIMSWNDFLMVYYRAGGRRIDERRQILFTVLGALKGAAFCGGMERNYLEGTASSFTYGATAFAIVRLFDAQIADVLPIAVDQTP